MVTYRTVSNPWSQWGWRVAVRRPVPAFSRLSRANAHGFTLTGTHDATVKTPRFYVPGATAVVGESGPAGDETRHVTADGRGQLRIPVPLSGDATSASTRVKIKPLGG